MSASLIRQTVDFFAEHLIDGATDYTIGFGLTGEPLLSLDDFDLIRACAEKRSLEGGRRIRCIVGSTNGMLLSDEVHDRLSAADPVRDWPVISLDGPARIHDAMRPLPDGSGSYARIEPRVKRWLARDNASASATLTGFYPYVTDIFRHLFELGFRSIPIKPVRVSPDTPFAVNAPNLGRVKEEYSRFARFLLEQDTADLLCYLPALSERDFLGRFLMRLARGGRILYRCPAGKTDVSVGPGGAIYPCDSFVGIDQFRLGDVHTGIDENRRQEFLALRVDEKRTCRSCWARHLCGGGCYYSAWLATGRIDAPDPSTCALVRHLIAIGMSLLSELRARDPEVLNAYTSGLVHLPPSIAPPTAACPHRMHSTRLDEKTDNTETSSGTIRLDRRDQCRGPKIWRGPSDLSATIRSTWDQERFHLIAEIEDDIHCPPPTIPRIDGGDSLQFALAPEDPESERHRGTLDMYEYILGLIDNRPICIRLTAPVGEPTGIVPNPDLSILRDRTQTTYRVAIPWSDMPALRPGPGKPYRFALVVNERDDPRQSRAWMEWTPGLVVERNPACFGKLHLVHQAF